MAKRFVLFEIRLAVKADFFTEVVPGQFTPKWGVPYFEMHSTGEISKKMKFLNDDGSGNKNFNALFKSKQIYVFENPDEAKLMYNSIDWELLKEVDYEIQEFYNKSMPNNSIEKMETNFEMVSEVKEIEFKK